MSYTHQELAQGRWHTLTLSEQLGNIGSEVSRALKWRGKDRQCYDNAINRALELFDLTLDDPRWKRQRRLKEICRAREVFCDAFLGGKDYGSTLEEVDRYLFWFALAARRRI